MERTIGIELEVETHCTAEEMVEALMANGLSATTAEYGEAHPNSMVVKPDSSVDGWEITTPYGPGSVLNTANFGRIVEVVGNITAAVRDVGAIAGDSCGLHIHVGASEFEPRDLVSVLRNAVKFEDHAYRIGSMEKGRMRYSAVDYARRIDPERVRDSYTLSSWSDFEAMGWHQFRGAVNVGGSFRKFGTVEWRLFNATTDPSLICGAVLFAAALTDDSRKHRRNVASRFELGAMHSGRVKQAGALLRLQQVLTTKSADTDRLLTQEQWTLFRNVWDRTKPQPDPDNEPDPMDDAPLAALDPDACTCRECTPDPHNTQCGEMAFGMGGACIRDRGHRFVHESPTGRRWA